LLLRSLFQSVKRQACCGRTAEPPHPQNTLLAGSRLPFSTATVCRFLPFTRLWRLTDHSSDLLLWHERGRT